MTSVSLQEIFLRKAQCTHSFVIVAMGFHPASHRIKHATRSPYAGAWCQYLDQSVRGLQRSVEHKAPGLSPWWRTTAKRKQATSDVGVIKVGDMLENFWPDFELLQTVARRGLNTPTIICATLILKCVHWIIFAATGNRINNKHVWDLVLLFQYK